MHNTLFDDSTANSAITDGAGLCKFTAKRPLQGLIAEVEGAEQFLLSRLPNKGQHLGVRWQEVHIAVDQRALLPAPVQQVLVKLQQAAFGTLLFVDGQWQMGVGHWQPGFARAEAAIRGTGVPNHGG